MAHWVLLLALDEIVAAVAGAALSSRLRMRAEQEALPSAHRRPPRLAPIVRSPCSAIALWAEARPVAGRFVLPRPVGRLGWPATPQSIVAWRGAARRLRCPSDRCARCERSKRWRRPVGLPEALIGL